MTISDARNPAVFLLDNGSLRPASTVSLRRIAAALSAKIGRSVEPVSLLHSSAVSRELLGGVSARILEPAVKVRYAQGVRSFLVLPLFFGPSGALREYVPERISAIRETRPDLDFRLARPLVDPADEGDRRMARILADRIFPLGDAGCETAVIVVDHGSPRAEVAAVRDHVADQLRAQLCDKVCCVVAASMERRPGPEFAFCEPLLRDALEHLADERGVKEIVVALLFVSPGRHAGPGGDIESICQEVARFRPELTIRPTELVGEHPLLLEILEDRVREVSVARAE